MTTHMMIRIDDEVKSRINPKNAVMRRHRRLKTLARKNGSAEVKLWKNLFLIKNFRTSALSHCHVVRDFLYLITNWDISYKGGSG
jgi:hypothetical protein